MILVVTDYHRSVMGITDWLLHYKVDYLIISSLTELSITEINSNYLELLIDKVVIRTDQISVVYFWRGAINLATAKSNFNSDMEFKIVKKEYEFLKEYLMKSLSRKCFNLPSASFNVINNKLFTIELASLIGLQVPDFIVTGNKSRLIEFVTKHNNDVIIKTMSEGIYEIDGNDVYQCFVRKVEMEEIEYLNDNFELTFFQKFIEKEFEIRVFFIEGEFYVCNIFDTNLVNIDYRKSFNSNLHLDFVRGRLTLDLKKKLRKLMNMLHYNMASIDLIFDGVKSYLLEVNPLGYFDAVNNSNYIDLNQLIAKKLIEIELKK
jgi:glutathione synthase/RimK-type ligase-like ATP-grasp enzyme